jgi:predicted nucleotidyltransferase
LSRESSFDIYIEEGKRLNYLFSNLGRILADVKHQVQLLLPGSEVYLFGSAARGKYTALSDIDMLIISDIDDLEQIDKIRASLRRKYIDYPIEFHIVSKLVYDKWYKRFIPEEELIKI